MRLIDEILSDSNIDRAILQVKRNKGVSGVDKMTVDELDEYFYKHRREIRNSILNKKYKPQAVKRVYIPKPNGKKRPLGIPTVVDRVIQQAIAQVLMKKLDSSFSEFSYGFRQRRSAQMAVLKTVEYINEGYDWVIDLDIEVQKAIESGECAGKAVPEVAEIMGVVKKKFPEASHENMGFGSTIFAVKPGDGSAREQAASCQKVLGGWANIANEYATKRYRSNLINWGMLPFIIDEGELPFHNLDYIFLPGIKKEIEDAKTEFEAYVVKDGELKPFTLKMGELTDDEREIILKGCLINYNRK